MKSEIKVMRDGGHSQGRGMPDEDEAAGNGGEPL
jgi:hypothetical protein